MDTQTRPSSGDMSKPEMQDPQLEQGAQMSTITRYEEKEEVHRRNREASGYWYCFDCQGEFHPQFKPVIIKRQKLCNDCAGVSHD